MLGHRTNFKFSILGILALGLQACTQTIDGGSIEKTFSGIDQALVLGPNAVELNWTMNSKCEEYEIFVLSTSTSESAAKVTLPPYRFKTLNEGSPYKFAVGCVQANGVNGQDTVLSANTWQKFSGNIQSKPDETGSKLELTWNYPNVGTIFSVYAKEQKVPGDLSDWALPTISGKTGYNDTPICVTGTNKVVIGPGGDCVPAKTLDSGKTYHFKVVAQYPDGTFSNDIKGNGTTIEKPADFKPPTCSLTQTGFGSDIDSTYLYLRCFAGSTCSGVLDVQAFQNGEQVSDKMEVSSGLLTIKPKPIPGSANNRKVEGLELRFGCTIAGKTNLSVVRYDDSKTSLKKPSMKFGESNYEAASPLASEKFPSNMGMASVVGDFNCNGKPDIAFGLPNVTYNQPPYYNRNGSSGLVKIIYDYATSATGSYIETPESTQYITFRDLPGAAYFGQSLSAGNINRDVYVDTKDEGRIYGCDDLIISAPGINSGGLKPVSVSNGSNFTGAVYVFYGQRQKFPRPLDSSSLPVNMPSCSGSISTQICSPVRLSPDVMNWLKVDPRYSSQQTVDNRAGTSSFSSHSSFGYSVSFIRDFNADGYGDLAIGDPFCDWDGEVTNGIRGGNGDRVTISQVGCVYVYWGGPSGIQSLKMGKLPDGSTDLVSPFAKIYPPFPRLGMHFGASISNGGEVDNRPPVPIKMNDNKNVILANGSDFIVGAPDFQYSPSYPFNGVNVTTDRAAGKLEASPNWTVTNPTSGYGACTGNACPVDPQVARSVETGFATASAQSIPSSKNVMPWNGAWDPATWTNASWGAPTPTQANLKNSTGIAFLFRGRSPLRSYSLKADQGFTKFPKGVNETGLDTNGSGYLDSILNNNYNSRSNGSKYLKLSSTDWGLSDANEWQLNPVDSFYNCGNRGSPRSASASPDDYVASDLTRYPGLYKHVSCLAGRNNFSVIYPALKTTDSAVSQFGLKVQISGGSDQNAIALFEYLGYQYAYQTVNDTLISFSPGQKIQPTIRGSNLWEMGIQGLSVPGLSGALDQFTTGQTLFSAQDANSYVGSVVHSPISESYSIPTSVFPGGVVNPVFNTDINRDGYADVSVTAEYTDGTQTKSKLYTYFGNYAADFQATDYTSTNSCVVNRLSTFVSVATDKFQTALPGGAAAASAASGNNRAIEPYTTFKAEATVSTNSSGGVGKITYEFPETFVPTNSDTTSYHARLSYLDDVTEISTAALDYNYQVINRTAALGPKSFAANRCKPQVSNQFTSSINALSSADLNNDGLTDLVIGMSGASSNQGLTYVYYAKNDTSSTAHGLSSYTQYIKSAANQLNGSSVSATNWLFTDNTSRRDLFSGAKGHDNGAGAVYQFSASGNQSISTVASNPITDNSNSPNNLSIEWSKVIGDVNGDGRADILVPLKLVSAVGSNYYDALIYFGSPFGPITYSYCMSHLSVIKNLNGTAITASDCLGSVNFVQAKIDGETEVISLPLRIEKQSGFSFGWVFNAYEVGDVNRDGFDDMVIFDYGSTSTSTNRGMYLFFGSSSGIMNGSPQRTSNSTDPQIVTTESAYLNFSTPLSKIGYHALSAWITNDGYLTGNNGGNYQNFPIKHGDFNGDGFEDLAFAIYVTPPGSKDNWVCGDTDKLDVAMCVAAATEDNKKQSPGGSDTAVAVLYGSAKGYQTPSNTTDQLNDDFDGSLSMTGCSNFYGNSNGMSDQNTCTYTATGNASLKYVKEVYDTLGSDQATGWFINTKRTACNPSTGTCQGQVIRRPDFYNITSGGLVNNFSAGRGWWIFMAGRFGFGTTLTVADTNNDGIDDLVVSDMGYWMPGFDSSNTTVFHLPGDTTKGNASLTGNSKSQGRAYIYYGAQGAGLVAPNAFSMLGDRGLGLQDGPSMNAVNSMPPFALYPMVSTKANFTMTNSPELEKITLNTVNFSPYSEGYTRRFGINTTAGDFNGDGFDDLAVTTGYGQAYVYYGPICQLDNDKRVWSESYKSANNNLAIRMDMNTKGIGSTSCSKLDLKFGTPLAANTDKAVISSPTDVSKTMYPQVMTIPGVTTDKNFGALLLSKRPKRSVASLSIISNPGNIDNDPEGTSDLVIGSAFMQDPNVAPTLGTQTGVAYVLFGHKDGSGNSIKSNPGLWYGTPGYTSALLTEKCSTSSAEDCYYHQPIYLRGYSADGLVGRFFSQEVSIGDLNGDKSGDLVLPTVDYQNGYLKTSTLQNMSVVNGGGLKLVY